MDAEGKLRFFMSVSALSLVVVEDPGLVALLLEDPDVSEVGPESEHSHIVNDIDQDYQCHLMYPHPHLAGVPEEDHTPCE